MAILHKCNIRLFTKGKYCKAIMNDLLLFTPTKKLHMSKLEDLLKALFKNRLKISPRKCQLFRKGITIYGEYHFY